MFDWWALFVFVLFAMLIVVCCFLSIRPYLAFFLSSLIVFVWVWYTWFACVGLAIVCDVLCVSCIVVVRVDCFRFGSQLLFVFFACCYCVLVC